MRFTVSEPPACRLPGSGSPALAAPSAASSSFLFPGTLPTLGFTSVSFVFVVLTFPLPSVCTGELCRRPAESFYSWEGPTLCRFVPCSSDATGSKVGACALAPLNVAICHPHPAQEPALALRAAPPVAARAGSMEMGRCL